MLDLLITATNSSVDDESPNEVSKARFSTASENLVSANGVAPDSSATN
jgi:hypothetical protein